MKEMRKLEDTEPNYIDILYKEYIPSKKHQRMPLKERAAQFSPFAALTGYDDEIKETMRLTESKIILDEEEKIKLDEKINTTINNKDKEYIITYFIKDNKKSGGEYKEIIGKIKRIDEYNELIIMTNKTKIPIKDIIKIDINCED